MFINESQFEKTLLELLDKDRKDIVSIELLNYEYKLIFVKPSNTLDSHE